MSMSDLSAALIIWLPLGTIVPFVVARLTGADWRGAFIEASIFATLGIIIFPITLAFIFATFTRDPNIDLIYALSYALAVICILLLRRYSNRGRPHIR